MQQRVIHYTLYGTADCHLCEAAEQCVSAVFGGIGTGLWHCMDIAESADLLERYGNRIPVLREDSSGHELDWPFDVSAVAGFAEVASGPHDAFTQLHTI